MRLQIDKGLDSGEGSDGRRRNRLRAEINVILSRVMRELVCVSKKGEGWGRAVPAARPTGI